MSLARNIFITGAGAASLVLEVALNRLCGLYMGESMLASTLTLSIYLLGFSTFPLVMHALRKRQAKAGAVAPDRQDAAVEPARTLLKMLTGCGFLCLLLGSFSLAPAPLLLMSLAGTDPGPGTGLIMAGASLMLFLAGYLSGALLPLLSLNKPEESLKACAAFNFGACGGGLLSGLVLLPLMGISKSFLACAGLYFLLCLTVRLAEPRIETTQDKTASQNLTENLSANLSENLSQIESQPGSGTEQPASILEQPAGAGYLPVRIYLLVFSCLTLFWETAVLRLIGQLAGSAVQALAMTAAVFIAGLSLGNWLGLRTKPAPATAGMVALLALALLLSALSSSADLYSSLRECFYQFSQSWSAAPEPESAALLVLSIYLALPLAISCGLLLPSCYLFAARKEGSAGSFSLFYGLGSLAAALAPFLFCLTMESGISLAGGGTLESSLRLSLMVGAGACAYLYLCQPLQQASPKPWLMGPALVALILLAFSKPGTSAQYLSSGRGNLPVSTKAAAAILAQEAKWLTPIYFQDGFFSSVALTACLPLNLMTLRLNGNVEASMALDESKPSPSAEPTHRMLALLPYLLQEKPDSALIVGLGLGTTSNTAARLLPSHAVTTVELEPQVARAVEAASNFSKKPRFSLGELVIGDGRTYLALKDKNYSLITVQPSEPWVAGAGALFTREFLILTRNRLKEDGVFSQWLQLYGMKPEAFRAYLKTFQSVYPNFLIFHDHGKNAGEIILLGLKGDGKKALSTLNEKLSALQKSSVTEGVRDAAAGLLLQEARSVPQEIQESLFRLKDEPKQDESPVLSDDKQFMQYHSRLQDTEQALLADSRNRKYLREHTNNVPAQ